MRTLKSFVIVLSLALLVAACGGAPAADQAAAPAAGTSLPSAAEGSGGLVEDYPDALSVRNQLSLGTLRLEGTANAITAAQATSLLPLWQALKTLSASSTSATKRSPRCRTRSAQPWTPHKSAPSPACS